MYKQAAHFIQLLIQLPIQFTSHLNETNVQRALVFFFHFLKICAPYNVSILAIKPLSSFQLKFKIVVFSLFFVLVYVIISPFFASNMSAYPTPSTSTSPAGSSIASSIGDVKSISSNYPYFGQLLHE